MKITINRKSLIDALSIGASMAGKAKTMPILECAKMRIKGDIMTVTSTDIECWVVKRTSIISADSDGEFCANPTDLFKALKSLSDDDIVLNIENNVVEIVHAKGHIEFSSFDASIFPKPNKNEDLKTFVVDSETIFNWLNIAKNFVSNDSLKPIMNGAYLYIKDGRIGICATDGHKLFTDSKEYDGNNESVEMSAILPSRAFASLINIINGTNEVVMLIDNTNITFATESSKISCRAIEGNYPNFRAVIPSTHAVRADAKTKDLRDTISRVSLFSNATTSLTKLSVNGNTMLVSGEDVSFSKKAEETVEVTHDGNSLEIGVKGEFMVTCLNACESANISLLMNDSSKPIVFKDDNNPNMVVLLMPMLIG